VVERVAGMPYEQYVQENILAPLGIHTSMRVGRTLPEGRSAPGEPERAEATYYGPTNVTSVFPYISAQVPQPYGEWYQEGLEGAGGWVANAPALVRLVDGVFGRAPAMPAMFSAAVLAEITAAPSFVNPQAASEWIGLGWQLVPVAAGLRIRAAGGLRGTMSEIYYFPNGTTYAYITNSSRLNADDDAAALSTFLIERISGLPGGEGDLYSQERYLEVERRRPTIRAQKGVVHGASFEYGVVSGSWMSILGWNLANTTRTWTTEETSTGLPTSLDGVEVFINDKPAVVYYISPTQINIQVPDLGTFSGTATLRTVLNGVSSHPEPIEIRANAPEFFRYDLGGKSWVSAVFTDGVIVGDPSLAPGLRPARTGDIVSIYGTGLTRSLAGQIIGPAEVAAVPNTVVRLGTTNVPIQFSGLTGAGLFQVNIFIPAMPPGDYPVNIGVEGIPALRVGTLAIR
jgi:uncharacterized protein (TIGR03437 family)